MPPFIESMFQWARLTAEHFLLMFWWIWLFAAGLWRPHFVTYAGLAAFYLGTLVMPFALPRYFALFGVELGKRVLVWLVVAVMVGALVATGWWWGLHGLAGLLGLQDAFHALTDSTLRPSDVPWFHHWFAPGL